jgi:predicted acyl esterase
MIRPVPLVLAAALALAAACSAPQQVASREAPPPVPGSSFGQYRPAPRFTERISESLYLPMRDGTRLAVRLDRPAVDGRPAPGPFPVLWHHTLSIDSKPEDGAGGFSAFPGLTAHGYVVAQVARRGNGQSFGVRRGYNDRVEAHDAYEVTEWLATQPWSTGKVGIYGCSNTGDAALHALTVRPPHLAAAFAGCFAWDKYDAWRVGGIAAQWGTGPARTVEQDMQNQPVAGDEGRELLRQAALEHQASPDLAALWRGMPFRDSFSPLVLSRFWSEGSAGSYSDQVRGSGVPLYIVGGWRDELRGQGVAALLNVPGSRLLIGPWKHCENAGFALVEEAHRFFDRHLVGIDTGIDRDPPVHYATPDSDVPDASGLAWQSVDTWPPVGVTTTPTPLGGDGVLGSDAAGGRAFTVGAAVTCPAAGTGPTAQPCPVAGAGTSWIGPALAADTTLTGSPVADLQVRVDRPDAHVFVHLEDVAPDGTVTVITEGRLQASLRAEQPSPYRLPDGMPWHRAYAQDVAPLGPGEVARLRIGLLPTSYLVRAGHRVQVTVTGADHRASAPLPDAQGARIEVLTTPDLPSLVHLPIAPV